jgi:hypothetical protein
VSYKIEKENKKPIALHDFIGPSKGNDGSYQLRPTTTASASYRSSPNIKSTHNLQVQIHSELLFKFCFTF